MTETRTSNQLLAALSLDDRERVIRSCDLVELGRDETVYRPRQPIEHLFFVEGGFLSVIATEGGRDQVEIGVIGREGAAGVALALDCRDTPFRFVVQAPGRARRMSRDAFRRICEVCPELERLVLTYSHVFATQVAETARANARQTVESRLARWLLMAHDRLEGDELSITHETLSLMLGVRRPGVTVCLHVLEGEHAIRSRRGTVTILDRDKLIAAAKGSYGLPEAEHRRFIPAPEPEPVRPVSGRSPSLGRELAVAAG